MIFTYKSFSSDEADQNLWNKVQNSLNALSDAEMQSVKIASSDQKSGNARTLIITTDSTAPNSSTLGEQWLYQEFDTNSDYSDMYSDCVNFLNSDALSTAQKYFSHISMTNAHDNKSNLMLWYRDLA